MMLFAQAWDSIGQSSIWAVSLAIGFFTIKGILWLAIPFLIVHYRKMILKRNASNYLSPKQ
jgi:hypothetical protein